MMRLLRLALAIGMLGLAACATVEQGTMSGTRMDLRDYRQKKVGILDVVVNPSYPSEQLPLEDIENSITTALARNLSINAQRVALRSDAQAFPLTPQRMADIVAKGGLQKEHGLQAVIGASIIAWSPPSASHRARISLIISFVDLEDSSKKWVMSGTWKAPQLQGVPATIDAGLGMQFLDLEYWLRAGLIPWFADQNGPEDPVLTYYSPSESLATKSNTTSDKFLPLIVSSIDDSGLQNLSVLNRTNRFDWQPPQQLMSKAPVYVSSQVNVPLQFGSNTVMVNAINATGHRTERKIVIDSTARRGLHVLGVGIDENNSGMEADQADDAIRKLDHVASTLSVPKLAILKDQDATAERVFGVFQDARKNLGQGDELLIVLTGRGGISSRDPHLELYRDQRSAPAGLRGFESDSSAQRLHLSEVLEFAADYPALIVLDLCTDSAAVDYMRMSLNALLKTLNTPFANTDTQIVAGVSDCKHGVGALSARVADQLALIRRPSERTTAQLFARTNEESLDYLVWTAPPIDLIPAPPLPEEGFWAVAEATVDRDEAIERSNQLKARGASSNVVLGTNGLFNITLGNFATKDQAQIEIRNAASKGWLTDDTAYVLAPERVKLAIDAPAQVP